MISDWLAQQAALHSTPHLPTEMPSFGSLGGTSTPLLNGHSSTAEAQSSAAASTSNSTSSNLQTPSLIDEYSDYYADLASHLVSTLLCSSSPASSNS